jgi:hypothetical protein
MANKRYAHVAPNGYVFEIFQETDTLKLTDLYNPVTAALFQVCPDNVEVGWWLHSGIWTAEPPESTGSATETEEAK